MKKSASLALIIMILSSVFLLAFVSRCSASEYDVEIVSADTGRTFYSAWWSMPKFARTAFVETKVTLRNNVNVTKTVRVISSLFDCLNTAWGSSEKTVNITANTVQDVTVGPKQIDGNAFVGPGAYAAVCALNPNGAPYCPEYDKYFEILGNTNYTLTLRTYRTDGTEISGVNFWVDDGATLTSPANVSLLQGTHVPKVIPQFDSGNYEYTFNHWEDSSTSNPRSVTLSGAMTVRAYYDRTYIGGGGCPYVFAWNGESYLKDNNILPASEIGNGTDTRDYYKLEQSLVPFLTTPRASAYALQVREFEHEIDYVDQARLVAVDHPVGTSVAVTAEGEIFTYTALSRPIFCIDNHGVDRLNEISTINGNVNDLSTYYQGCNGDWLLLNFGRIAPADAKLVLRDDQKCTNEVCIDLQVPDGKGGWLTIEVLHPRDLWSMEAVNLAAYVPKTGDFRLRLLWTAPHRLDYVGLDTSKPSHFQATSASPILALHSTLGDVRSMLLRDDEQCAELVNGQQITLVFMLSNKAPSTVRDFILYTNGYYYTITP